MGFRAKVGFRLGDASPTCARASSSSRPVSACLSGENSGSVSSRDAIMCSCDRIGCSGHSSSSSASRSFAAVTGSCSSAISPACPPGAFRSNAVAASCCLLAALALAFAAAAAAAASAALPALRPGTAAGS